MMEFDVQKIRSDFPILSREVNGKPLVYLDSAATAQKPLSVIQTLDNFYREYNANVHRGVHYLSEIATSQYENVRHKVKRLINATSEREIVFVRGATEAINLVAQTYGRQFLKKGDEILITTLEHHANIVPWQQLCQQIGAKLKVAPVNEQGEIIIDRFTDLLGKKTKLVAISHISNAIGTISPIKQMITAAHAVGAKVLVDGCQAAAHSKIDVQALNCDFYTFSSHKVFGPTGVGVLYGKLEQLDAMPPYQTGGDMITSVSFKNVEYAAVPHKFEAGTPNIAGTIAFGAAIDYLSHIGIDKIVAYEQHLLQHINDRVKQVPDMRVLSQANARIPLLSFLIDKTHPNDLGSLLDQLGIAVRTGHHCAMPLLQRYEVSGTVRASFCFYNTIEEIDQLFAGIERVKRILIDPEPIAVAAPAPTTPMKAPPTHHDGDLKSQVIDMLRTIFDPEIPINIYDLGLIYEINIDDDNNADIKMTLTTPGCPVAETFPGQVQQAVSMVEGINKSHVELIWDPPWTSERMTEAARLELGMF